MSGKLRCDRIRQNLCYAKFSYTKVLKNKRKSEEREQKSAN